MHGNHDLAWKQTLRVKESHQKRNLRVCQALPSIGRSPQKTDKDLSQNLLRDGHRHSVPNLASSRPITSSSRPATSASTRGSHQSSAFAKQCRKMASKETIPVIKFDEAFDMAYRLAVKRVANDRKQVQVSMHKNASQTFSEVLGSCSDCTQVRWEQMGDRLFDSSCFCSSILTIIY